MKKGTHGKGMKGYKPKSKAKGKGTKKPMRRGRGR